MHAVFLRVRTVTFPQVHSYTYIPKGESCVWFSSHIHRRTFRRRFTGSGETLILYNDVPSESVNQMEEGQTTQWTKDKRTNMIYKTLHRKRKIEQHEPH
jgi:hypothetical protein